VHERDRKIMNTRFWWISQGKIPRWVPSFRVRKRIKMDFEELKTVN